MIRTVSAGILALLATFCAPARAELILMVGGGVLKVDGFSRSGDRIELQLPSGGSMTIPVLRIDRIVADELEEEPVDTLVESDLEIEFAEHHSVPATPYGELIYAASRRPAITPRLNAAMVRMESAWDPRAVSLTGATGLLQLLPSTAHRFGVSQDEIFDPVRNLAAGVRYVRWLNDRFNGDLALILAGYNAGEAAVERYQGVPPYKETRDYIRRVYSAAVPEPSPGARE